MYRSITATAASELSLTAVECVAALVTGLGPSFDPLVSISNFPFPPFYPFAPARAVFICRAKVTIETIINRTRLHPRPDPVHGAIQRFLAARECSGHPIDVRR